MTDVGDGLAIPAQPPAGDAAPPWSCAGCGGDNPAGTRFCGHCGAAGGHAGTVDQQRLVTALFADISGFTALADTLDAEHLHRVISPVIALLSGVAEGYGGTLAKYAGDAVLVFFGAPVALEDHAVRALRCALDMHDRLAAARAGMPPEARRLSLHIGVNTGRVVAGMFGGEARSDYSILGDAVNVAQRLESVAGAGETYVGATTHQLTVGEFSFEDLGGVNLKGKPEPVPAWRLVARRERPIGTGAGRPLVGRDAEARGLADALSTAGLVVVYGEAGAGKSRLLDEVLTGLAGSGTTVLQTRAVAYGTSIAYWPFVDLLRRSFGITFTQDPATAAQRLAAALEARGQAAAAPFFARLLGLPLPAADEQSLERLAPEAFSRLLTDALVDWVTSAAVGAPLVLAVEDVQWLDSSTAELLARLTVRAPHHLTVALTGRADAEAVVDRVGGGRHEDRAVRVLRLAPLDREAVAALLASVLAGPVDDEVASAVFERAGGNPLFVEELARALRDVGALEQRNGRWRLGTTFDATRPPPTVESVIAARIDRLPRRAVEVLETASVIGRRVDLDLLRGADDGALLPAPVDDLVSAGLLDRTREPTGELVVFHNTLVLDVAYSRLVLRRRCELHRRVGETAEALYGAADDVIDLLARHFYLADAGVKAVDYLERAAARARRLWANEQAALHLQRAVGLTRTTPRLSSRLPRLLLDLADVEELSCGYDDAVVAYEEVRDLTGDVRAWCGLSSVYRKWGRYDDAVAVVDEALPAVGADGDPRGALLLERAAALAVAGRYAEAVEDARSGLAEVGDREGPLAANLLLRQARTREAMGRYAEGLDDALAGKRLMDRLDDARGQTLAARIVGGLQWLLGRHDEAAATLRDGLALAERTGSAEELGGCLINLGMAELKRGRLDEGVACDERAVELFASARNQNGQATAHANLAEKLALLGRLAEAEDSCHRGLALARQNGQSFTAADAHRTLALIRLAQGRPAEGATAAEESARLFLASGGAPDAADALTVAARCLDALGDAERAREVLSRALSLTASQPK